MEAERKAHEEWLRTRSKEPIPVSHPDVVLVKILLTTQPPPRYIRRLPDKTKYEILKQKITEKSQELGLGMPKFDKLVSMAQGSTSKKPPPMDFFCEHGRERFT